MFHFGFRAVDGGSHRTELVRKDKNINNTVASKQRGKEDEKKIVSFQFINFISVEHIYPGADTQNFYPKLTFSRSLWAIIEFDYPI